MVSLLSRGASCHKHKWLACALLLQVNAGQLDQAIATFEQVSSPPPPPHPLPCSHFLALREQGGAEIDIFAARSGLSP